MKPELVVILALHVTGLAIWSGSLLYLPAMLAAGASRDDENAFGRGPAALNRMLFTSVATPAALFAIVTGSVLFLFDRNLGVWLILKLTAVAGMVICHILCGALILRQERKPETPSPVLCAVLGVISVTLIGAVLWLVLAKPF